MKEFIICSAIDYKGNIICGRRHNDCNNTLRLLAGLNVTELPEREKQGFITSLGRFIDRKEAFLMAKENNQIYHKMFDDDSTGELTSEDIFPLNEAEICG